MSSQERGRIMDYMEKYRKWVASDKLDEESRKELLAIQNDDNEIKMRFLKELEFGTAGLRGTMKIGAANMNIYTVRHASCGLAKYISKLGRQQDGVAIAFDCRNNSKLFALETAKVLAAQGVKSYIFDTLRPTPELSFAVRYLGCAAGVNITASHNPKEYNGYKVYGDDGAQVVSEAADAVTQFIAGIDIFDVETMQESKAREMGLINTIGEEVDEAFYKAVMDISINRDAIEKAQLSVVYTPFHGAGNIPVREVLKRSGLKNIEIVKEQELPDGNFPTVKSPNPENPEGFALAVQIAKQKGIDLIVGTDPDSDRIGLIVKNDKGEYVPITGNQTGALLVDYVLSQKKDRGELPLNAVVIKTIVTNEIIKKITDYYNTELIDVLTGFKFIAEKIKEYEKTGEKTYVFGFEESYGYLPGTYVRDKDAVGAALLIIEMASWYKLQGMTVYEGLLKLYEKYGEFGEWVDNIYFEGVDGMDKIAAIMDKLRANPPKEIGGSDVLSYTDVKLGIKYDKDGNESKISLPSSNVLRFETEDGTFVAFRPSGTEPKFKIYTGFFSDKREEKTDKIKKDVEKLL